MMSRIVVGTLLTVLALASSAAEWRPRERWRGFNLVARFWTEDASNWPPFAEFKQDFDEFDFQFMHDFGFNFARVPVDCRLWYKDGNPDQLDDAKVAKMVDPLLAWGAKYGVHINLCFYYAPGYSIAGKAARHEGETLDLHANPKTLDRCARHWAYFAKRYKGVPNERLSFNLFNEPSGVMNEKTYAPVAKRLIEAIHAEDPDRFVISDGIGCARKPTMGIVGMENVGQAFRGYWPGEVTHYRAVWAGNSQKVPVWPLRGKAASAVMDDLQKGTCRYRDVGRELLYRNNQKVLDDFMAGAGKNTFVMIGEFGCHCHTPHPVMLAWMEDNLKLWKERNLGWAMWNLRGPFGVVDSKRSDVEYEDYRGHKVDRRMLDLLRKY